MAIFDMLPSLLYAQCFRRAAFGPGHSFMPVLIGHVILDIDGNDAFSAFAVYRVKAQSIYNTGIQSRQIRGGPVNSRRD
jgi:hypothetical protein